MTKLQLLVATHNPSKLKRYQKELINLPIELISLQNLGIKIEPPLEIGADVAEICKNKAQFYFEKTKKACFSNDSGLYFEKVEAWEQPGINVKGIAHATDDMPQEEIYTKMIDFYQNMAAKYGGKLNGYFLDSYCVFDGQKIWQSQAKRPISLTNQVNKKDIYFPICSLYKVKDKFYHDLTPSEMSHFLAPSMESLQNVIKNWLGNAQ